MALAFGACLIGMPSAAAEPSADDMRSAAVWASAAYLACDFRAGIGSRTVIKLSTMAPFKGAEMPLDRFNSALILGMAKANQYIAKPIDVDSRDAFCSDMESAFDPLYRSDSVKYLDGFGSGHPIPRLSTAQQSNTGLGMRIVAGTIGALPGFCPGGDAANEILINQFIETSSEMNGTDEEVEGYLVNGVALLTIRFLEASGEEMTDEFCTAHVAQIQGLRNQRRAYFKSLFNNQ